MCSERGGDLLGVAAGGDDGVTGGQGGLGDVDAHAAAGAGDEPNLLVTHAGALLLLDPQVVLGTALSVVHCYRTTRRPPVGAPDDGATDRDPLPQRIPRASGSVADWLRLELATSSGTVGVAVADRAADLREPDQCPMRAAVTSRAASPIWVGTAGGQLEWSSVRSRIRRTGRTRRPRSRRSWVPSRHRTRVPGPRQSVRLRRP